MFRKFSKRIKMVMIFLSVILLQMAHTANSGTGDRALMPTKLIGSIVALIQDESQVIIEMDDGTDQSLLVPKTSKILRNDQRAEFTDLQVGDQVSGVYLPGPRKVVQLRAISPDYKQKSGSFGTQSLK